MGWNIFQFQPGGKRNRTTAGQQKQHANEETSNNRSPPQPAPEPRAPTFKHCPRDAQRVWAFAADAEGHRLETLWQGVKAREDQPLAFRPGFGPFVTALRSYLETAGTTDGSDIATAAMANSVVGQQMADSVSSPPRGCDAKVVQGAPALATDTRGIPVDAVRGLAEAVLSASVCSCGREVVAETRGAPSSAAWAFGCPTHGLSAISWARILPSGTWRHEAEAIGREEGDGGARVDGCHIKGGCGRGGGDAEGWHSADAEGTARRRACLIETLYALSAACRWSHARDELARLCDGGGIATGLASLCDALCSRVTELKRRQQGPFRRPHIAGSIECERAQQDLLFFVHCLAPLAGLVTNSAPAAGAWYDLVNAKTLGGTGLPSHPWVSSTESRGGVVASCCPVFRAADATNGAPSMGQARRRNGESWGEESSPAAGDGHSDKEEEEKEKEEEEEEDLFLAMLSAANTDEWSAMLVGCGLVRSLVNSLQACLDVRITVRGLDFTRASPATRRSGSAAIGGDRGGRCSAGLDVTPGAVQGADLAKEEEDGDGMPSVDWCLGCELETAQVVVMMALGALLSAHPLAARDRFQRAGGALRVHRIISYQPDNSGNDEVHVCVSPGPEVDGGAAAAPVSARPCLQEHCVLVALQMSRLSIRAEGTAGCVPLDVLQGAARLVGALSPAMLSTWHECQGPTATWGDLRDQPLRPNPTDKDERFQDSGLEDAGNNSTQRGVLSHELLPLDLPGEVVVPLARGVFGNTSEGGTFAGVEVFSGSYSPTAEVRPLFDSSSYRLCGPRPDHPLSSSRSAFAGTGWVADRLQVLARDRGPGADKVVSSVYSRLATSLDTTDISIIAQDACRISIPPTREGNPGSVLADGGVSTVLSECPPLLLMGFYDGMLDIIGDCDVASQQRRRSVETSGTGAAGIPAGIGPLIDAEGAALRSALACVLELFVEPEMAGGAAKNGRTPADGGDRSLRGQCGRDEFPVRPGSNITGRQEQSTGVPVSSEDNVAVAAIRQLLALKFLHQAVRRWPRLAVKLSEELGLWDVIFSEHFLAGCACHITCAIELLSDVPADAAATGSHAPGRSMLREYAVGWGLVHDGTLLLLEAVAIVRCLLQLGPEELKREHEDEVGSWDVGDQNSRQQRSSEIEKYVTFFAREGSNRSSDIAAMQGCKWLTGLVAMESALGISLVVPPSLRVASLCLAFKLCDRGNDHGSDDAWVSDGAGWPLVHASLSLTADMVATNEGLLFQAAVAYAVDADAATGMITALPAKPRPHRATASMTSDALSSALHAASAWYTTASGGSHTPASINSLSPRTGPSFSFCDTHGGQPPPKPPRPLPEVLFKAALEPRARRAVFYCAAVLGAEASKLALASVDGQQRETAAAVLSGLVEGYLCLCERAAVATVAGSAATDDGPSLLLDALHGACALMRSEAPRNMVEASTSDRGGIQGTPGGAENGPPSRPMRQGDTGVLPLLQETFREHWASARLLVVLESVAGDLVAFRSIPNSSPVPKEGCSEIVIACLSLFTAMMARNSLGKKAIRRALSEHYVGRKDLPGAVPSSMPSGAAGWGSGGSSFVALANLAGVVSPALLCESLVDMLMDGEVPECVLEISQTENEIGRDQLGGATRNEEGHDCGPGGREEDSGASSPPEIRNPFVVPLIFQLLPEWPASEQENILKVFQLLLKGAGGGTVNRSLCCDVQPALMDQLLDVLPRLNGGGSKCEDSLQELAIDLVRLLGSHSINVAQLKKIFRLLQPLSAVSTERAGTSSTSMTSLPLQPPWMCSLLRALRGMMDDEPGPQRFFLLDGLNSGLRLPRMPHWPAQKGYTFCAWVRLEVGPASSGGRDGGAGSSNRTIPVAEAPCLFSFCGEQRGQGVAACFIPRRKKRGSVQRGAAAPATTSTAETPQQYALELRVGAGRKKPPAIVRFPGIVVTPGEWVFVAVAHAASRWGQRGEASVLVDSSWRTSASPFPRFGGGGVATASIACHCPRRAKAARGNPTDAREGAGAKVAGRPVLCSLQGQMGPIYLFEGSVSESLLRGIRQLGPGYAFSFEPPQVDSREVALLPTNDPSLQPLSEMGMSPELNPNGGLKERNDDGESRPRRTQAAATAAAAAARQHLHIEALSGPLTSRILLAYNPSVWGGEYFLDNTPEHNPVRWTNNDSQASSSWGGQTERGQMIYSMAGSQAHVLVQPPAVSQPRVGDDGGNLRARRGRHGPARGPLNLRPDAAAGRNRVWSGCSGGSGVDNIDHEGERAVFVRPRRRPGHMHAMRLPGTRECVTRDVRDALDCLGGVKVLLPLFAQYDHGVHRGGAARVSYRTDPRLNETVLALLVGTLRDSVPNQRFLRRHGGLSLIPFCLERVSPQHMNAGALAQACRLAHRLGAWSEDWADSTIESLLSPSRLWVFAPTEVQLTLVGVLRGLARRCPHRMRRVVGVQQCLDALDLYYWYTPPASEGDDVDPSSEQSPVAYPAAKASTGGNRRNRGCVTEEGDSGGAGSKDWSYMSRQWVHPSTGEVLGVKASGAVLGEIRARLLDTVVLMACDGDGVCRADVAAILGFLRSCRDDLSRCEALRLVLRFTDDPHQAGRFVVASGYVATEEFGGEDGGGDGNDDDKPGHGPGRGGTAVSLFLSQLRASDPTVRLLAFLALGQTLIACLRIDSGSSAADNLPDTGGPANQQFPTYRHNSPQDSPATTAQKAFAASVAATTSSPPRTSTPPPSTSKMVEFVGGADAKAEELVVLTGAPSALEGAGGGSADEANSRRGHNSGSGGSSGGADVLELRGGVWEHIGLSRHKIDDVLQWAQRQATGAEQVAAAGFNSGPTIAQARSWEMPDGRLPRTVGSSEKSKRRPEEEAAAESAVARVTMEVLQGLLIGQLPRGFAASVVDSREHPGDSKAPTVSPATDQALDPFFLETPPSFSRRKSGSGDRPGAPSIQRSRSRSWRTGPGRSSDSPPLCIHLPEAFPALCQQVAMAPLGAALRGEAIETLVAAVQSQRNAEDILCVDSWQQYLLSVVSSAQGRQAVATAAASASDGENYPASQTTSTADGTAGDGDTGRYDRRIASDEAAREGQLVDRTVRLICWLAMCKARSGKPGRPGAGFAELQDTMSFLRCQGELGTMACVSVGESMLRYMVTLLKREVEYLESEVNGWARGSHLPSVRPMLGSGGGHHGAAAVLACVWPLAALVVEFVTIPPVANPPAAAAANAPTPSAAARAVVTAAISDDEGSSRWSEESLACQSPIQGILQWFDTGTSLPSWPSPPSSATRDARAKARGTEFFSREVPATRAAGWRAWELLDATVDLIGPTGDTLLWDARYRQGLFDETGATSGIGKGVHTARTVDPGAEDVLDWGRRECRGLGSSTHSRRSPEDRGTPGAPRRVSGGGGSSGSGFLGVDRATRFIDSKGKTANPLADAGDVPWMLVRILLAVFVGGGAAGGHTEDDTPKENPSRRQSGSSSGKFGGGSGKGGGGAGNGPPSTALVALQRLIALLNSLESSGYEHLEFEVLNVAARVSTALRTTCLTPKSAWVLGALQLLAKCLATQGAQIEDLLVAAEERLIARDDSERKPRAPSAPRQTSGDTPALQSVLTPRARLSFSRRSKPKFWLWDLLTGGGGDGSRRRRITPKGVLHQIAAETPSLAAVPSADLALEIIRRTLGIELPGRSQQGQERTRKRGSGVSNTATAAPLTWDLLEAAFEPISEDGAGHEAAGLARRLDRGGMHKLALQTLVRVRALEGRGGEAGIRVPADVLKLMTAVKGMEISRALALAGAKERATTRRQAQWKVVLKQLATERGPWGRGVEALGLDSVYWTLSPREDDHGRRLKLIRNPSGSLHTIASERTRGATRTSPLSSRSSSRAAGGQRMSMKTLLSTKSGDVFGVAAVREHAREYAHPGVDEGHEVLEDGLGSRKRSDVREMSAQTSLWRDLCKYQQKSVRVRRRGEGLGEQAEETEEEEEEEEEEDEEQEYESEYGEDNPGSGSLAEGSSDVDVARDGSRRNRQDTPATFSSAGDVVRASCVTPGTILVEGHRLVFTRLSDASATSMEGENAGGGGNRQGGEVHDNYRWALRPAPTSSWPTSGLRRVLFRPYGGMRFAALEMWFRGGGTNDEGGAEGSLLLGLPSDSLATSLFRALRRTRPPSLEPFLGRLPATVVARSKANTWGASTAGGSGMFVGAYGDGRGGTSGVGGGGGSGTKAVSAAAEMARTPLTQAWARRRCGVTNFDYLRGLNAAAGRTTSDLSRYPVFPWVLSERAWGVEELDLKDERNFRDLAWPMGAQRPEQREMLHMRFTELERSYLEEQSMGGERAEMALPPFHHGTHYSTSAYVMWFLMRLEPFTSLHIHLQDGRFDKADRLFQSLPDAYRSCTHNPGDVKEAIPELYYLPELFVNATGFDLGCTQATGKPVGDVELPRWAHGDPWEFVRRHREALESEHVSLRLHRWIDLVFGCKQRPPALDRGKRGAVDSCNVFFHLTYPGAVDLPRLREQDSQLYESTMRQIEEFGQAPAQLFKSPHPRRLSIAHAEVVRPLASPVPGSNTEPLAEAASSAGVAAEVDGASAARTGTAPPPRSHNVVSYPRECVSRGAVLVVTDLLPWAERLVTIDTRRAIGFHGWRTLPPERSPPFRLRAEAVEVGDDPREIDGGRNSGENGGGGLVGAGGGGAGPGGAGSNRVRRFGVPFAPDGVASSRLLEPPPLDGRCGNYGLVGDDGGDVVFTRPLGGLGGSHVSLASMGSLLSLPQASVPASQPQQLSYPGDRYAKAKASTCSSSRGPLLDAYDGHHHDDRRQDHEPSGSTVPVHTTGEGWNRRIGEGVDGGVGLGSHLFAVLAESCLLFSGGHWDSSFRATALDTGRLVVSIARHRDVVTSLSLADGGKGCRRLVTASRDTTLMVWRVEDTAGERAPPVSPSSLLHVLYGHDTPVTCVCARVDLDAIVSSGEDGTVVVHTLWSGEYVRTITPQGDTSPTELTALDESGRGFGNLVESAKNGGHGDGCGKRVRHDEEEGTTSRRSRCPGVDGEGAAPSRVSRGSNLLRPWASVEWVGLSAAGYVVAYSPVDATLRSYTVNGHPLGAVQVTKAEAGPLRAFVFSEDGTVLLSGGHDRVVTLRWAHGLALADDGSRKGCGEAVLDGAGPPLPGVPAASAGVPKFGSAVRALALTAGERHLLVGLEDGTLGVLALDANYLRQRLRSKLDQLGI